MDETKNLTEKPRESSKLSLLHTPKFLKFSKIVLLRWSSTINSTVFLQSWLRTLRTTSMGESKVSMNFKPALTAKREIWEAMAVEALSILCRTCILVKRKNHYQSLFHLRFRPLCLIKASHYGDRKSKDSVCLKVEHRPTNYIRFLKIHLRGQYTRRVYNPYSSRYSSLQTPSQVKSSKAKWWGNDWIALIQECYKNYHYSDSRLAYFFLNLFGDAPGYF